MSLNILRTFSSNRGDPLQIPKDDVSGEVEKVPREQGGVENQRKEETNTLKGGFQLLSHHHLRVKFEMI
jgi:hypothetical protein